MIEQQQYDDSKPKEGEEFSYNGRNYVLVGDIVHEVHPEPTQIAELLPYSGSVRRKKDKVEISIKYSGSVDGASGILGNNFSYQPSQPPTQRSFIDEDNDKKHNGIRVISLSDLSPSPAEQPSIEEHLAPAASKPQPAELEVKDVIPVEKHIRHLNKSHKGLVIGAYAVTALIVGGIAFSANGVAGGNACAAHGLPNLNVISVVGCISTGYLSNFGITLPPDGK